MFSYEFAGFQLNPSHRSLLCEGKAVSLRPIAFELLLLLVESPGKSLTKNEIIRRMWGLDSGDDRNFHVTLHTVRRALGESGRTATFIVKDANGYPFVPDVHVVSKNTGLDGGVSTSPTANDVKERGFQSGDAPGERPPNFGKHRVHVFVASSLYGALFAVALILEVSYEFDRFGTTALKIAPLVFVWVMTTAIVGLT